MPFILVVIPRSVVASALQRLASALAVGMMSVAAFPLPLFETVKSPVAVPRALYSWVLNQYSGAELFARLTEYNNWQKDNLVQFSAIRTYRVEDDKGKTLAKEVVLMQYKRPAAETFKTVSANGSAFIRGYVFKQLMRREAERATGRKDRDSSITPDNYTFEPLGKERIGSTYCSVVHAIPKRKETYLFDGKVWIGDQDFAIVKVAGHLAKSPSSWIKRVDFVRQYQKIDGFWLPIRERSIAKVRLYGTKILTIDYRNYAIDLAEVRVQARHQTSCDSPQLSQLCLRGRARSVVVKEVPADAGNQDQPCRGAKEGAALQ
jgi:hypothetical protein